MIVRRLWLIIGFTAFFSVLAWWWHGRENPPPIQRIPDDQPGLTLVGTSLVGMDKGKKVWEVEAGRIWRSKDGLITIFEDIKNCSVYSGDEPVHFRAPIARLDQARGIMTIQGGIEGRLKDGGFSTSSINIDLLKKKLVSNGTVRFRQGELEVSADSFQADLESEIISLVGNVVLKNGEQSITGRELEYDLKNKTYQLQGETEVEMKL